MELFKLLKQVKVYENANVITTVFVDSEVYDYQLGFSVLFNFIIEYGKDFIYEEHDMHYGSYENTLEIRLFLKKK